MKKAISFLVRFRTLILSVMLLLTAGCIVLIPRININSDLTRYLPADSQMKQGIDRMARDLPDVDTRMRTLNVMFTTPIDREAEEARLARLTGGLTSLGVRESPPYTLFEYRITGEVQPDELRQHVSQQLGENAVVEVSGEEKMPSNLSSILALGVLLAVLILMVMCSSWMEIPLILLTLGTAVAINMGTNALLESVSMLTNSLVAVLQMVLSMDYSIMVMNRYRQERALRDDKAEAMVEALHGAAPSVLSSALTTIVSLLMLVFLRFRIGADLGIVLAKGVLCSMICNFTVLPALILAADKALAASVKRVPRLPAKGLSRFETRFRIPLLVLFVALFAGSFLLQRRTPIAFSAFFPTKITAVFPPQNPMTLLYDSSDDLAVLPLVDSLEADPLVASCFSYPGLVLKRYTAREMTERFADMSPLVREDLLQIVFYARSHPKRDERLSFQELEDLAEELSAQGLVPGGLDTKSLTDKIMAGLEAPDDDAGNIAGGPEFETETTADTGLVRDSTAAPADTLAGAAAASKETADSLAVNPPAADSLSVTQEKETDSLSYEDVTRQLTARELAALSGASRSQVSTLFRMAGRNGRKAPATMSLHEFLQFITDNVLTDKHYASFIPKEQEERLRRVKKEVDAIVAAGPSAQETEVPDDAVDSLQQPPVIPAQDTLSVPETPQNGAETTVREPETIIPVPETPAIEPPTPLETLAEMAFSGQRYSAGRIGSALRAAGIPIAQDDLDLLFLYAGSRAEADTSYRMSASEMVTFLADTLLTLPALKGFVDENAKASLEEARKMLVDGAAALHSGQSAMVALITDYERESPETFDFVEQVRQQASEQLEKPFYLIGESVMFKELKGSFPSELLLLTLLTVLSIFLIVALTFRSVLIPVPLIMTVLSGVYVNVFVSGLGGNTMFFLAYLIVQSILMGATIDYSILLTSYYRDSRKTNDVRTALADAYRGAGHSILTSGLILVLTPMLMAVTIDDAMIAMILKSLSVGALASTLIILLVFPGVIVVCDRLMTGRRKTER